jgi:Putative transposase/Transposase zinc-binding domain
VLLQEVLRRTYPDYSKTHRLPGYLHRAVWALMACRTAELGGHIEACPEGHVERIHYNSCKHRACPRCAFIQVQQWLTAKLALLLPCDYYHVIFTLPHDLNPLWRWNVRRMTALLFAAMRDTVSEFLHDEKYLGATPGILAALHTWGQTLVLHPHLHCLITAGGVTPAGQWRAAQRSFLFPIRAVSVVFRGKFLAAIRRDLEAKRLQLPPDLSEPKVHTLLNKLGRKKWNVHIRERYPHGRGVLTYVSRYLRGGPLAERRLLTADAKAVTFWYTDNQDPDAQGRGTRKPLTVTAAEFLTRLLTHVPPPGLQVVRSFGLFATSARPALAACRAQLGAGEQPAEEPAETLPAPLTPSTHPLPGHALRPRTCPQCGRALIVRETFGPGALRAPPEVLRAA